MLQHYEVKVFSGYKNKDKNPSYLARMSNQLTHAITERKLLPKAIVVMMEDDLIVSLNSFTNDAGISDLFKDTITWLVSAFTETITEYHNLLPPKAKKEDYTKLLWFAALHHDSFINNNIRKKFNNMLYQAVSAHDQVPMNTIKLKGFWDTKNFHLVNKGKLTGEGLYRYWEAVDLGFKFWTEVMLAAPRRTGINENSNGHRYPGGTHHTQNFVRHRNWGGNQLFTPCDGRNRQIPRDNIDDRHCTLPKPPPLN